MNDNNRYALCIIDGDVFSLADDPYISSLMYRDLSWDKACELVQLSFCEGYECVIWQQNDESSVGADDAKKESS